MGAAMASNHQMDVTVVGSGPNGLSAAVICARAGLQVVERHAFGADYAKTMALWHERFLDCLDALPALGFDDRFVRMWRFYLSYCEAGFRTGDTDVIQFVLTHR
jgi:cyclopropane-fatty-acyl-phospholipid synthase